MYVILCRETKTQCAELTAPAITRPRKHKSEIDKIMQTYTHKLCLVLNMQYIVSYITYICQIILNMHINVLNIFRSLSIHYFLFLNMLLKKYTHASSPTYYPQTIINRLSHEIGTNSQGHSSFNQIIITSDYHQSDRQKSSEWLSSRICEDISFQK